MGAGLREGCAGWGCCWVPAEEPPAAGEGAPGADGGCGAVELSAGHSCCQYTFFFLYGFYLFPPYYFCFLVPRQA